MRSPRRALPRGWGPPGRTAEASSLRSHDEVPSAEERDSGLIMQPESREISQEQLATEVKSIYNGIAVIESKCRHVDQVQSNAIKAGLPCDLKPEHWQALIGVHRSLLHEHHDFFLASQHPSASPAIKRLAEKYSMPARFWRHGIHSFLEILRHRLPESHEYMLAFLCQAYHMLSLLYETVRPFESTWIECLGDAARYRMAIEDQDVRDREIWTGVARYWYGKAADRSPRVGRLYHHLAILSRPNVLRRLYFYSRSLASVQPFPSAKDSIVALFDPAVAVVAANSTATTGAAAASGPPPSSLALQQQLNHPPPSIELVFAKAISLLYENKSLDQFDRLAQEFLDRLDEHFSLIDSKAKEQGVYIIVTLITCLFELGAPDPSVLRGAFLNSAQRFGFASASASASREGLVEENAKQQQHEKKKVKEEVKSPTQPTIPSLDALSSPTFLRAWQLTFDVLTLALDRFEDANLLPLVHVCLIFLLNLGRSSVLGATDSSDLARRIPWPAIVNLLNSLSRFERRPTAGSKPENTTTEAFPEPEKGEVGRPLPEDYLIRELVFCLGLFPEGWFENAGLDEEERGLELGSTGVGRGVRVLWLGGRIASVSFHPFFVFFLFFF